MTAALGSSGGSLEGRGAEVARFTRGLPRALVPPGAIAALAGAAPTWLFMTPTSFFTFFFAASFRSNPKLPWPCRPPAYGHTHPKRRGPVPPSMCDLPATAGVGQSRAGWRSGADTSPISASSSSSSSTPSPSRSAAASRALSSCTPVDTRHWRAPSRPHPTKAGESRRRD